MWLAIASCSLAALILCALAAILLRIQKLDAPPNLIHRFAGLVLNNGFRLIRRRNLIGDRQLIAATLAAWLLWTLLAAAVIAIIWPGYDPTRMFLIYGLLSAAAGAVAGFLLGALIGSAIAKARNISNFEGGRGYFILAIALLGGIIGLLTLGITMTIFFHKQGHP